MPTSALFPAYSQRPLFSKISDADRSNLPAVVEGGRENSWLRVHPVHSIRGNNDVLSEEQIAAGTDDLIVDNFGVLYDFATRAIQSTRYVLHHGPANQRNSCISRSKGQGLRSTGEYRVKCARHLADVMAQMVVAASSRARELNWVTGEFCTWEGARYAKSGNCGEHASGVFTWALRYASNIRVAVVLHNQDHQYCLFAARVRRWDYRC
ncbi:MAG: hypothetical protein AAF550_02135 [Myxococcota bacterium]